jgi:glycosyltransferase involved in cell wall biosynthesis
LPIQAIYFKKKVYSVTKEKRMLRTFVDRIKPLDSNNLKTIFSNVEVSQSRLLIVQYAGDYREAVERFDQGGDETYYAQRYSVDAVADIGGQIQEAAVLCCLTEEAYNEVLSNKVRAIGAGFKGELQIKKLIELIEEYNPTHLILRTPLREVLRWAIQHNVKTLALLADSFSTKGVRSKLRNYWLANLLNSKQVEWVSNHGINSSRLLQDIGVNPDKIIPWDYIYEVTPDSFSPKAIPANDKTRNLIYIGSITESKGIGDVLDAIANLKAKNLSVNLKVAGRGELEFFNNKVKELQIEDCVKFLGLVQNKAVVPLMREADIVLIPSRHEYPEGFPLTIYEALCSGTPIVASDHPMFVQNLKHEINAMIFPAGNSVALAECLEKLLSDPALYHQLSATSYETWKQLQIPVKWADLIKCWLFDSSEDRQWLFNHRLSSGIYRDN